MTLKFISSGLSKAEILEELPKLNAAELREIHDRILQLQEADLLSGRARVATERNVEPASPIPTDLKVEQNTQAVLHFGDDFLLSCRENRSILNRKLD